jgi:branched-chain amino acid transport system permease protein
VFQQLINAIVYGSVLTLFALGLSLAWGTLDVLNLAHGAVFVFAGFLTYELAKHGTFSFVPTLILAMIGAGLVTLALELVAFRHIRTRFVSRRQAELSMLVASIGAATIINQVVSNETNNTSFGPASTLYQVHEHHIGHAGITNIQIIIIVVAVVAAILLDVIVRRTRYGRAIRSVAYDPATAGLLGVNVNLVAATTMFVAGLLAGVAGVLLAVNLGAEDPSTGQEYLLTAFAILIVGGVGSIRGAVVAAYLIAIVETAVIAYGPSQWQDGVAFLLILLVLLLRPQGLFARARFRRV